MPHTAATPLRTAALTIHVLPGTGPHDETRLRFVQPGAQDVDTVADPAQLAQLAQLAVRSCLERTPAGQSTLPHPREQATL